MQVRWDDGWAIRGNQIEESSDLLSLTGLRVVPPSVIGWGQISQKVSEGNGFLVI